MVIELHETKYFNMSLTKKYRFNFIITLLLIVSPILGNTSLKELQIISEIILWLLLIVGVLSLRLSSSDLVLLATFIVTSVISFSINDFNTFGLNFKLFGLCIFTFVYFRHIHFNPGRLMDAVVIINALLILHQFIFGEFIIQDHNLIREYYRDNINSRPVGLFLTPHASSAFLIIYLIYKIGVRAKPALSLIIFIIATLTSSFTAIVAFIVNYYYSIGKSIERHIRWLKILPAAAIVGPLLVLYFFQDEIMGIMALSSYTRYYSMEIMLDQIFNPFYYRGIFNLYPSLYADYISLQEANYGIYGNEIGFVKVFVEGGFILGGLTIYFLFRELSYFRGFIFITFLHYSFVINMPIMLFLMLNYNREIWFVHRLSSGSNNSR